MKGLFRGLSSTEVNVSRGTLFAKQMFLEIRESVLRNFFGIYGYKPMVSNENRSFFQFLTLVEGLYSTLLQLVRNGPFLMGGHFF